MSNPTACSCSPASLCCLPRQHPLTSLFAHPFSCASVHRPRIFYTTPGSNLLCAAWPLLGGVFGRSRCSSASSCVVRHGWGAMGFNPLVSWWLEGGRGLSWRPSLARSGPDGAHRCGEPVALMDHRGDGVDGLLGDAEMSSGTRGKFV